ncbi:MAG: pantetheine-phosphate adenylyltransferase [Candidatus Omnitrophica bacterium]|nr:pantetheine-phosphate adenylyltransferase [Candidatus Omnitrophota bacterium]
MLTLKRAKKFGLCQRWLCGIIGLTFFITTISPTQALAQTVFHSPASGERVTFSQPFTPPLVRGLTIDPNNPLKFDFIIGVGDEGLSEDAFQKESMKLIKYFLAALTVPENDMWVNLSPYEKDRIIPEHFGKTKMGQDLLAQDYLLKQLTASFMNPQEKLGAEFWSRVRIKAQELFGATDIPMDTFNKVWIVPDKARVYVKGQTIFVVESHLKVMLEEEYLAISHQPSAVSQKLKVESRQLKAILKEIILPAIEQEVNEGKNFALLRQIQNSAILAAWYKKNLKQTLLGQSYVDQKKTNGINSVDKEAVRKVYQQYLDAFKKGACNYIKEDYDPKTQTVVPRKYFSGGIVEKVIGVLDQVVIVEAEQQLRQIHEPVRTVEIRLGSLDLPTTKTSVPDWRGYGANMGFAEEELFVPEVFQGPSSAVDHAMLATPQDQKSKDIEYLPSYKLLQMPQDELSVKKFESYRKQLTGLLKQKFPQDPLYANPLTREQFETLVVKSSLLEKLGDKNPLVDSDVVFYAGSFDPFTKGHLEVVKQAAQIYKKVYIGMGINPDKKYLLSTEKRKELIEESLQNAGLTNFEVVVYEGMTVREAAKVGAGTLIRGIRNMDDLKDEIVLSWANQILNPQIRTALITTHQFEEVSSSKVKADLKNGKNIATLVTEPVLWELLRPKIDSIKKDTKIIGLVGGIGSGKSTVLQELQKRSKTQTIDLDKVGHVVLKMENVRKDLVEKFGEQILTDGEVDRVKLRAVTFQSPLNKKILEQITIPQILWQAYQRILEIKEMNPDVETIVIEGIGIVDASMERIMDEIWFVDAPAEVRIDRSLKDPTRKALNRAMMQRIIEAQRPMLERAKAKATVMIDNSTDQNGLAVQIEKAIAVAGLRPEWNKIMQRLGVEPRKSTALFQQVIEKYFEKHRHYHTVMHVADILRILDSVRNSVSIKDVDSLELAIFFHDVIYNAKHEQDEDESTAFAEQKLGELGIDHKVIERVKYLIQLTKTHQVDPTDSDAILFTDLDLTILGQSPEAFDQYDQGILEEYPGVPVELYREVRKKVLKRFDDKQIFRNDVIRVRYETQAHENLKRAIKRLGDPAMVAQDKSSLNAIPVQARNGGIDLNSNEATLEEQGGKIKFLVPTGSFLDENLKVNGFVPVIIHITPPTSLPLLLQAVQTNSSLESFLSVR